MIVQIIYQSKMEKSKMEKYLKKKVSEKNQKVL